MNVKFILAVCFFILLENMAIAQKITKNETDKFTGNSIVETKSEYLFRHNFMATGYDYAFSFAIRKVNNAIWSMPCNILLQKIEKYDESSGVTFLLENGHTVNLYTMYTGIGSEKFAQGYFFNTVLSMTDEDISVLKTSKITDVRINYFGNHYDYELKGKNQDLVMRMIRLVEAAQ